VQLVLLSRCQTNNKVGRFSQETKRRPQKLVNIIDRLTPALLIFMCIHALSTTARGHLFLGWHQRKVVVGKNTFDPWPSTLQHMVAVMLL